MWIGHAMFHQRGISVHKQYTTKIERMEPQFPWCLKEGNCQISLDFKDSYHAQQWILVELKGKHNPTRLFFLKLIICVRVFIELIH